MATVTIKDIARMADVSTATVSYVINKSRTVSPELAQRVLEAIETLGYRPNGVARSLRQQRTSTIGLIVPDNSNPFFAEIAKGVEDAGFDAGYTVVLCNSNSMFDRELAYLDMLWSKRVDGVIFFATTRETDHLRSFVERGIPVVAFYREAAFLGIDTFRVDNRKIGHTATRYLIDLGHRAIACIKPASAESPSMLRVNGYVDALQEAGLNVDEALMPRGDNLVTGGREAVKTLLTSGRPFSAIFAGNDAMAIGAMTALREAGLHIPRDVSIVGVDDIILASYAEPPLTTVAQPKYEAGRQAVDFLCRRIEGTSSEGPHDIVMDTHLVVRKSCAPYAQ